MALYRRGNVYWVSFTGPDGRRVQRSTGTEERVKAQELHDKWKADVWRIVKLGEKPRRVWQEAVVRWSRETSHKASHGDDRLHLAWLNRYLRGKYLDEIDRDLIDRIMGERIKEKTKRRCKDVEEATAPNVSNATVNRMLEVLRAVLRRAANEWKWLSHAPKIRMLPEPKRRVRWLTHEEADRLLAALPKHLAEMARFSLATGLRERNVTLLEWSQVDLERRHIVIHADQAKARKAIAVPLSAEAVAVLRRQRGKHKTRVFTYQLSTDTAARKKKKSPPCIRPVSRANTKVWRRVLKEVGIADFRWHDLRHTWASWHVQRGTPLHVLQELGGWETLEMVQKYAHMNSEHLRAYVDKLSRPQSVGDIFATVSESGSVGAL